VSYSNLIRLGGLGAMVGGVGYAGVGLLEVHLGEGLVYIGNIGYRFIVVSLPLGTMAAIVALYALHRERYGRAGAVFCLTAVLGLALATGALTLRVLATYPICLSGLSSFQLAHRLGLTRSERWHGALGNPFRGTADTASMVRDSSYGRESTRGVIYANSLGGARSARRRVVRTTRQSVPGAGRRALCGGWLLHLPSGRRANRATCKSALRTLDFRELRKAEVQLLRMRALRSWVNSLPRILQTEP
jgi:hypothetical protein